MTVEVILNGPDESGYPILELQVAIREKIIDVRMDSEGIFAKDLEITPLLFFPSNQKIITDAQKALDLSEIELITFEREIMGYAQKFKLQVYRKRNNGKKLLDECPYIYLTFGGGGNPVVYPNIVAISTHLIEKFQLLKVSTKEKTEDMSLWRSYEDQEYGPILSKGETKDLAFISEMQEIMKEYGYGSGPDIAERVKTTWIDRIEILNQARKKLIVQPTQGMFPMANGILNIKTLKLITEEDDEICIVKSPIDYDATARCPVFDAYLMEVLGGDQRKIDAFCSWIGAVIAGMNPHIVVLISSRGRSGKGIVMGAVTEILGSMCTTEDPDRLKTRFQNWAFFQRRLVYLDEEDCRTPNYEAWKAVSGLAKRINFEKKNVQGLWHYDVQCAIFAVTNSPPSQEKSFAWEERLKYLEFPFSYGDNPDPSKTWEKKADPSIQARINNELPGIFNKFIPFAQYALDHPDIIFKVDIPFKYTQEALERVTNPLESFIDRYCETCQDAQDKSGNLKHDLMGVRTTDTTFKKKLKRYCEEINIVMPSWGDVKIFLERRRGIIFVGHNIYGIGFQGKSASEELLHFEGSMEEE
jgi:hypothetical protein